ncbi:endonuclease domain-containing protein [Streptosporangium lutulentum]|uniref:Very-short-patch-repair endonuclease n=1 Tax=Streptosporangium lutulentum TaxID=1461250 RepID=A0ABT9QNF2_9ACTN|nr:DUF559 domain-containing protein [Streptosporangium lutulentum]MDP9848288.1 very-short-patch-repair endonuclease [Streptosporangium lutulentum]
MSELEKAAVGLFPAWLPGAEDIGGPGGAGGSAVRALALRTASVTGHFGPFLAHLAELSLRDTEASPHRPGPFSHDVEPPAHGTGQTPHDIEPPARGAGQTPARRSRRSTRFAPEVRAVGLARVLAAAFDRSHTSIIVHVPAGLSSAAEEVLVAGCEWLAHRGELGIWLTGAPLIAVDRVETVTVRLPPSVVSLARELPGPTSPRSSGARAARTVAYPAVAGVPHPASSAEQALETALSSRDWATGRAWNQTYRSHPLANPVRLDLLWREERCVVEIDGPDHGSPLKYAADRQRDVQLQLDGYAVLRFTNVQVMTDAAAVIDQIKRFLRNRRLEMSKG